MHYNIALEVEKTLIFIKEISTAGNGYEAGILEPVEDKDEIRFLISVGYGQGNGEGKTRPHPTPLTYLSGMQ